ncbi:MAG: AAA family ATPase [Archaeoglobaceae archaeon]
MIIEKLRVKSHGKINDLELELSPNLNVIYGENEAGKSTLQNFILCMLYGPLRLELKTKKFEEPAYNKKPWNGGSWGGHLIFKLNDGDRYELIRDFDRKRVQVSDEFGKDKTNDFGKKRNSEVTVCDELLGVDKNIFRDTVFISQDKVDSLSDKDSLRSKIQSIVASGSEDSSSRPAISKLDNTLESIGTERATRKLLGGLIYQLRELEDELGESEETFNEMKGKMEELQDLRNELGKLTEEEERLENQRLLKKKEEIEAKLSELDKIQRRVDELHSTLSEKDVVEIGEEDFQKALEANTQINNNQSRLKELQEKVEELNSELDDLKREHSDLGEVGEIIDELEQLHTNFRIKASEVKNTSQKLSDLQEKKDGISSQLDELSDFSTVTEEDKDSVYEYETRKQYHEEWFKAKQERIEADKEKLRGLEASQRNSRVISAIALVSGVLLSSIYFLGFNVVLLPAGVLLIAFSLIYFQISSKKEEISSLEEKIGQAQHEVGSTEFEDPLTPLFEKLNVNDRKEFLDKYNRYHQYKQEIGRLDKEIDDLTSQRDASVDEIKEYLQQINQSLSKIEKSLEIPEDDHLIEKIDELDSEISKVIQNLKEVESVNRKVKEKQNLLDGYNSEFKSVESNIQGYIDEINVLLEKYGFENFEELRRAYNTYLESSDERKELETLEARRSGLLGDNTVEELRSKWEELKDIQVDEEERPERPLEEIEQELEDMKSRVSRTRESIKGIEGGITSMESKYRPVQDIEEEIEEFKQRIDDLSFKKEALEKAKTVMEEAERDFTKNFVRLLNQKICPIAQSITSKYDDVRVNDELEIHVRDPDYSRFVECCYLSRGAVDQLYFILKVAIAEMLGKGSEPLPLVLDEVFANYDPNRLERAMNFLLELSSYTQVILFTCQKRQLNLLNEASSNKGMELSKQHLNGFEVIYPK